MYYVTSVKSSSKPYSTTFSEFMSNILETEQNYSISELFEIGSQIWKNYDKGYFIDNDYKIYFRGKEKTTLVYNEQIWISEINQEDVLVKIYYGSKHNPTFKSIQFNDYEQCQCYVEKQIILHQKKGYTSIN